jgi:hypothetical protein
MKNGAILQPDYFGDGERSTVWAFKKQQLRLFLMNYGAVIRDYNLYMDAAEASAKRPYGAAPAVPDIACTISDPVICEYGPLVPNSRFHGAREEAGANLVQTAMALQAFRLETGHYPTQLSELTPRFMTKVPADPFGKGGPLLYFLTARKYLLYSVGPDGKDNKGQPCKSSFVRAGSPAMWRVDRMSKGDMVAGLNR